VCQVCQAHQVHHVKYHINYYTISALVTIILYGQIRINSEKYKININISLFRHRSTL
jgi:hypothetical protein